MTTNKVKIEYIIDTDALKQEAIEALELELEHLAIQGGAFTNTEVSELANFLTTRFPNEVDQTSASPIHTAIRIINGMLHAVEPLNGASIAQLNIIASTLKSKAILPQPEATAVASVLERIMSRQYLYEKEDE